MTGPFGRLYPIEWVVLGFLLAVLCLYSVFSVPLRPLWSLYPQKVAGGLIWYGTGLFLCFFFCRLRDLSLGKIQAERVPWRLTFNRYRREFLAKHLLSRDLRFVHALALVFVVFIELKHLIPWVNFRLRDGLFLAVDKAACLGMSCGERVLEVFGPQAESLMSEAYLAFFPYLGFLLMVMVLQRNEKQAQLFCLSFALVWLLGILLVYLFPTLGPCFWTPEPFSGLKFSETALLRVELLQMSNYALAHPLSQKGAYLISGFPSLHLAAPTLGTAALWAVNRPLAILSLVFTVITMFSTLYFGWHYLLDNLGAIVLALGIYFVLERWWRG